MKFSLVIPAYNEERRIGRVIDSYLEYYMKKYGSDFELIVVVDGVDGTLDICKEYSRKYSGLKVDYSRFPQGKGAALIRGFKRARGKIIGFTDADESVLPQAFDNLVEDGCDCVVASRKVEGSVILKNQPFVRRFSSNVFNLFVNTVFGLSLSDTQCGAKVLRNNVVKSVFPQMKSRGFEFDVELLWRVKKYGYEIKEVPITWAHSTRGKFSLRDGPRMCLNLLNLRING